MARLIMQLPGGKFSEHTLERVTRVGRHPDQDLQVLDPLVSKAHLVIEKIAEDWYLRDLDSRNGTWLNSEQIRGRVPLKDHDRIKVGTTRFVFMSRPDRRSATELATVRIANQSGLLEAPLYREAPEEFLPVDIVPDVATLRRDYEKLRLSKRLRHELAFELRVEVLLTRILDHLFALFKADRGVILLVSSKGELETRAAAVHGRDSRQAAIQISQTIVNSVLESRTAVLTRDAQIDDRFQHAHSIIAQGIRSSMCAPLLGREQAVIGILHLDSLIAANAFTERDLSTFLAVATEAAMAIETAHQVARMETDASLRERHRGRLPPSTVERLVRDELRLEPAGELREVAVLTATFVDLDLLSSALEPEEVTKALNAYLHIATEVIFAFGGTINRSASDTIVAFWGAPQSTPDTATRAARCAVALTRSMAELHSRRTLERRQPLPVSVGLDFGAASVGNIGPEGAERYALVGAVLNRSRRLSEASEAGSILVTEAMRARASKDLTMTRGPLVSLGRSAPSEAAWRLHSDRTVRTPAEHLPTVDSTDRTFGPATGLKRPS